MHFSPLKNLAEGLRTGEIEWLEPLETQSAVELTRALIEGNLSHHCSNEFIPFVVSYTFSVSCKNWKMLQTQSQARI